MAAERKQPVRRQPRDRFQDDSRRPGKGSWSDRKFSGERYRNENVGAAGGRRTGKPGDGTQGISFRPEKRRQGNGAGDRAPRDEFRGVRSRADENAPREDYRDFEYTAKSFRAEPAAEQVSSPEEESESYILTGRNPIREALKNHRDLEKLLVQKGELSGSAREIVQKAKDRKVLVQVVEKSRLDEIAPHHQGLIAFASAYQYSTVEEILESAREKGEDPFIILLDGITDPHNLGAILRTAECAGAHGVIVPQHHSAGLSPAAVKASAGAVEYVKVARVTNLCRTLEMLQKENVWAYAVTMNGKDYRKADFRGGVALVIGAEEDGISRLVLEKCDDSVSLPMAGRIESLNASVAAGIIMYQVLARRQDA